MRQFFTKPYAATAINILETTSKRESHGAPLKACSATSEAQRGPLTETRYA
jgi:hypothetical protein